MLQKYTVSNQVTYDSVIDKIIPEDIIHRHIREVCDGANTERARRVHCRVHERLVRAKSSNLDQIGRIEVPAALHL